jgi:hypothetical protein
MIVYTPLPMNGYELCHPITDEDFETINTLVNGELRSNNWDSIEMRVIHEDEGQILMESDSPWLGSHALIFKQVAVEKMGAFLMEHGELLPIKCSEPGMYIFNSTKILDALDEAKSSLLRFKNERIMHVKKYEFRFDIIKNIHVFKIPGLRVSPTFVDEYFVNMWNSLGLTGLEFKEVWRS